MTKIPKQVTLTNASVDVLNVIRNNASVNYQDYVPVATRDADSIREIGAIIMDYPSLQNEFISALVNRIGQVLVTSKLYYNNLAKFKKGKLEYGESIEEIFVNLAKPFQFDPAVAESNVFKRQIPDVRAAFHIMNYQKFYKVTVSNDQLRQAFLSWNGVTDLIAKIVDSMYTAAAYDEQQVMLYMVAKNILNGRIHPVQIETASSENSNAIVTAIKGVVNKMSFMSPNYNAAGVYNHTERKDIQILISSDFDAIMDVNTLAAAFNMSKAEFLGVRTLVNGFGELDNARLAELFENDPTYTEISQGDLTLLNNIPIVAVDRDWFMVFDNFTNVTEQYNGEGLYWNYWYHTWKTFSVSPFAQAVVFTPVAPAVTSVTVSPDTATLARTGALQLTADVVTTGFAPQTVNWASNTPGVNVSRGGLVTVDDTAGGSQLTATITATSTADSSKSDSCTVTVPAS